MPAGYPSSPRPGPITVGVTGQLGFVGSALVDRLSLSPAEFTVVPFERDWFESPEALASWIGACDVVVHLAAGNRSADAASLAATNLELCRRLVAAAERADARPHILYSSSTQEDGDSEYGRSKRRGRELLGEWAARHGALFTGLVIPNVFGPFGRPHYNSVVATFCEQLVCGQAPRVDRDARLGLIYVGELVDEIIAAIRTKLVTERHVVRATSEQTVSDLLAQLSSFASLYLARGIFPALPSPFSRDLFNTFRSFIRPSTYFPRRMQGHVDGRGMFVELIRQVPGGQVSFSTTVPGVTRGNHFHTRKIERFVVLQGRAVIQLRRYRTSETLEFVLDGREPAYVDMPIWYSHNIRNVGDQELLTLFWINEEFDADDPDTYPEVV